MDTFMLQDKVTSLDALQALIGSPETIALKKQIDFIDDHCRRFIAHSPLVFISTANAEGRCDVSPKGDAPGFVHIPGERLLAIPERPGNRRADTMRNILKNPHVGLIFLIPGVRETLRVNGRAGIYQDNELLQAMAFRGKTPVVAICVEVEEVFLHCGRAMVRSAVWNPDTWPQAETHPSAGQIFADHSRIEEMTCEVVERHLEEAYTTKLY